MTCASHTHTIPLPLLLLLTPRFYYSYCAFTTLVLLLLTAYHAPCQNPMKSLLLHLQQRANADAQQCHSRRPGDSSCASNGVTASNSVALAFSEEIELFKLQTAILSTWQCIQIHIPQPELPTKLRPHQLGGPWQIADYRACHTPRNAKKLDTCSRLSVPSRSSLLPLLLLLLLI